MLRRLSKCLTLTTFHVLFLVSLSCYCCLQAELEVRSLPFTTTGAKGTKLFKFAVGQVLSLPRNKFLIVGKCADGFLPPSPQIIELQELEYISEMNWELVIGADSSTIWRSSKRRKKKKKACFYISKRKGLIPPPHTPKQDQNGIRFCLSVFTCKLVKMAV